MNGCLVIIILNYFKFLDFETNLKIDLSSVGKTIVSRGTNYGKTYVACALLRNALTYLYGNQTSAFFELDPPSL